MVKDKIRKSLLEQGLTLSSQSIDQLNNQIQKNIIESLDLSKMNNVLLYFPYKQEIKTNLLHQELIKYSHNIYMPKIFPERIMKFNLYTSEYSLVKNKYGITEVDNEEYLEPNFFDAMFIPFIGVDVNGYRIGYGGGYYDRFLESVMERNNRPLLIGLIYDFQFIDDSINESHDIKLDIVFSEQRSKKFSR